jgi:hypothetical protein
MVRRGGPASIKRARSPRPLSDNRAVVWGHEATTLVDALLIPAARAVAGRKITNVWLALFAQPKTDKSCNFPCCHGSFERLAKLIPHLRPPVTVCFDSMRLRCMGLVCSRKSSRRGYFLREDLLTRKAQRKHGWQRMLRPVTVLSCCGPDESSCAAPNENHDDLNDNSTRG